MQQRQPRLGDVLDDYCPRERRLTNHVVVAMIGDAVKQTRCTTCDSDHEYKNATIPRQRKKSEESALYSQVLAAVTPRKVSSLPISDESAAPRAQSSPAAPAAHAVAASSADFDALFDLPEDDEANGNVAPPEEGPAHRRLIRAQLPKHEGQAGTVRQAPDFTIRQPNPGRPKRFGARPGRPVGGGIQGHQNRPGGGMGNGNSNGNGNVRGGGPRPVGRPQGGPRQANRQGGGRNRPK